MKAEMKMNRSKSPKPVFEVIVGDITKFVADVIVNSAHESLTPGGGVSGAIHREAGPGLARECAAIVEERGWLEAGEAAITAAYGLPARFVVHAVAPRSQNGVPGSHVALSMAYQRSIELAIEVKAQSIVFPSLGTGIFGFPIASAPGYAMDGLAAAGREGSTLQSVTICCFSEEAAAHYRYTLLNQNEMFGGTE
jgi:O-acetyl-ADP-ribose deacetylase (regulator of RNase III)